jgi:hypothetical protein
MMAAHRIMWIEDSSKHPSNDFPTGVGLVGVSIDTAALPHAVSTCHSCETQKHMPYITCVQAESTSQQVNGA